MDTETFVSLTIISSQYSPEEIDAFVGVHCDKAWRIGDFRAKTTIKEKDNGWVLNSGLEKNDSLEDHVESLLKILAPVSDKIQSLSDGSYVEVSCAIYSSETPPLHFRKNVIHQINKLGASLDIDLYLVSP
jgi:hypothetical protein